jgi:hypothetical protein
VEGPNRIGPRRLAAMAAIGEGRAMTRYELDPEVSMLSIEAQSSLHPIRSDATGVEGWAELSIDAEGGIDLGDPVSSRIEFALSLLRSGNPLLDRETERRVAAKKHPVVSAALTALDDADREGWFVASGDVTFHGVTHQLEGLVSVKPTDSGIEINGQARFDVRDFGVKPPRLLALRVHPDVEVILHAHAASTSSEGDSSPASAEEGGP